MPSDKPTAADLAKRCLSLSEAAWYVGVCPDVFRAEIKAGVWPTGRPRGAKGGRLTWDRKLLDAALDRQSGLDIPAAANDRLHQAETDAWTGRLDGTAEIRTQRRQKA